PLARAAVREAALWAGADLEVMRNRSAVAQPEGDRTLGDRLLREAEAELRRLAGNHVDRGRLGGRTAGGGREQADGRNARDPTDQDVVQFHRFQLLPWLCATRGRAKPT